MLAAAGAFAVFLLQSAAGPAAQGVAGSPKQSLLRQPSRQADVFGELLTVGRVRHAGPRFAAGHIVVKFDGEMASTTMRAIARAAGASGVEQPRNADFHYVYLAEGEDPVAAAKRLAGQRGVLYAEPDPIVRPRFRPNDRLYTYQWNFPKIGMEAAWDINRGGSSKTVVAVVDTGVAYVTSGSFAQATDLVGTNFVAGHDFIWDDDVPLDTDGHGTHVTGTIAQTTQNDAGTAGMAFNVSIMPVKVLSSDWDEQHGAPNESTMSVLAQGIRFAVDHGAKVINLSLGSEDPAASVESALRYAVTNGAFVAIAAGNGGNEENLPEWPASYASSIEGVMAVGAVDYDFARAPYSTHRDYVEIAAPGGNVDADVNNDGYGDGILQQTLDPVYTEAEIFNRFAYIFFEGTSMSTAHVSGLAALLYDQGVTSPRAIEAAIKTTAARKPANGGRNDDIGYGIIDVRAALRGLGLAK